MVWNDYRTEPSQLEFHMYVLINIFDKYNFILTFLSARLYDNNSRLFFEAGSLDETHA